MQSRPKPMMLALRAAYLLAILGFAFAGRIDVAFANALIFAGSLFIPYLARKDERFAYIDAAVCAVFLIAFIPTGFNLWNDRGSTMLLLTRFDKLFHAVAGGILAWFAVLALGHWRSKMAPGCVSLLALAFTFAAGFAWETFEWVFSMLPPPYMTVYSGWFDGWLDIGVALVGAGIALWILRTRRVF